MQPRSRALLFLLGTIVLIGALVVIWRAMPVTAPTNIVPIVMNTPSGTNQNASSSGMVNSTNPSAPDGKVGVSSTTMRTVSTTQDLPFVDLPGRREGNLCDSGDFICVSDRYRNLVVSNPLTVTGTALAFEGRISWRLLLGSGNDRELTAGVVQAERAGEGMPAPFTIRSFFPDSMASASGNGTLMLYETSLKDGQPIHVLRIPVILNAQTSNITVFAVAPTQNNDCTAVVPVMLRVPRTSLPIEASLQRLLALRPTAERPTDVNSIPEGTKLLSFALKDGVATAVFSRELDAQVGGSCQVTSIREQITRTLKQFPSVQSVTIIAEGKTAATTLQP